MNKFSDSLHRVRDPAQLFATLLFSAIILMLLWSGRAFLDFGELFQQLKGRSFIERGAIAASEWRSFLARSGRPEQQTVFAQIHQEIVQASERGKLPVRVILSETGFVIVNPRCSFPTRKIQPGIIIVRSIEDLPSEIIGPAVLVHSEDEFASNVENNWRFAAQQRLPSDAKVFLNEPSFALYLIGTFMWYPSRVDVGPQHAEIRNDETFDAAFKNASQLHREDLPVLTRQLRSLAYSHLITRMDDALKVLNLREIDIANSQ